ncbi:MAG: hypothetical protein ABIJ18_03390 [archaeon]
MKEIIEKNIDTLVGIEIELAEESIGGNAGNWKGFGCNYIHFNYDPNTGEIIYIGNDPKAETNAGFKLAFPAKQRPLKIFNGRDRIVKIDLEKNPTKKVLKILFESAQAYNENHAFHPADKPIYQEIKYEGAA